MREVGVRELRASLSEMLRRASGGERIRVTVHGRPVADIVAPGGAADDERLRSLVAEGRLAPPTRPRGRRAPRLAKASRAASSLVLEDRDAQR